MSKHNSQPRKFKLVNSSKAKSDRRSSRKQEQQREREQLNAWLDEFPDPQAFSTKRRHSKRNMRVIVVPAFIRRITECGDCALLLGQVLYWLGLNKVGKIRTSCRLTCKQTGESIPAIAKSVKAWAKELGMEPRRMRDVIDKLEDLGFVAKENCRVRGHPLTHLFLLPAHWRAILLALTRARMLDIRPEHGGDDDNHHQDDDDHSAYRSSFVSKPKPPTPEELAKAAEEQDRLRAENVKMHRELLQERQGRNYEQKKEKLRRDLRELDDKDE